MMERYLREAREMLLSKDVVLAVVGALVSTFAIYVCTVVLHFRLPSLANILFWKKFAEGLVIAISELKVAFDPQIRPGDTSEVFFPSEVTATNNLLSFMRSQFKQEPEVISNGADFDKIKDRNLLLLGGTKFNEASQKFLSEIRNELFYLPRRLLAGAEQLSEHELKVFVGMNISYPNLTYDSEGEMQPVMIVLRKGLYVERRSVLLIAGLRQEASIAGVQWLLSRSAMFWWRVHSTKKGFQAIIRCRVISQYKVSNIKEVFYQELI